MGHIDFSTLVHTSDFGTRLKIVDNLCALITVLFKTLKHSRNINTNCIAVIYNNVNAA